MLDILLIGLLAFALEMVDNGLGGGYGTLMSPLLLLSGYDPQVVVPAILFSEMCSGLIGGGSHAYFKNVNWRSVAITFIGSIIAMIVATFSIGFLLPKTVVRTYISIIALLMGLFVFMRSFRKFKIKIRPNALGTATLGFICGFNKGMTGGGYGPLSVSGYITLGLLPAVAIGTTTVAEGIVCTIGFFTYQAFIGIRWPIALAMAVGSAIADPISAWINNGVKKRLQPPFHGRIIGLAMFTLGLITLLKTLGL
jgi:uncharacterized membrane protein YfcA